MRRLFPSAPLAALLSLGLLSLARSAAADPTSCTTDTDCSQGFTCQVTGATACPGYACPVKVGEDGGVAAADCPPPPACTPTETRSCLPGPCTSDADCASGMVCYTQTSTACTAGAPAPSCPPNADCAVPAFDAGCTTTTTSSCVPRYVPPCKVDSDCGPGFTCTPDIVTECSGGGATGSGGSTGSGSASGSGTTVPVDVQPAQDASAPIGCTTTALPTSTCVPQTISCSSDSDCPSAWTCTAQNVATPVCNGPASVDGGVPLCDPIQPSAPSNTCTPPYADLGFTPGGGTLSAGASGPRAAGDAGAPVSQGASGSSDQGAGSGHATSNGGCAVSAGVGSGSADATPLLALVGLAMFRRRRRAHGA